MPKWLKITLTAIIFVALTVALYLIGFKGDWIKPLVESAGWFGYIIYIILQVVITTLLCFVPATTFTFTLLSTSIFGTLTGLILSVIGCWLSSMTMFLVGRYGGTKLVDWLIGKDARIKAQQMVSDRATVLVPVMLACPFFPDDAICMVSGMTKMNFWYFAVMALFTRSIGVVATGLGKDFTKTYIIDVLGNNVILWIMLINIILFDIYVIWKLSSWFEAFMKKKRNKKLEEHVSEDNKDTVEQETKEDTV